MEWRYPQLREFCQFTAGGKLKLTKSDYQDEGYPAFSAAGQDGFVARAEFGVPGIVVSSIGARCGKAFLATGKWTTLANTYVILPDTRIADPRFLWYQLNDEASWIRSGSAQAFLKPSDIRRRTVALPTLSEQRRIVEILDQADRLRRLRAEADAKADRILPALFIKMFGDPTTNPMGWPVVPFDKVFRDITSRCHKIQRKHYKSAGTFPIVDQGQELIAGYTDDESLCYRPDTAVVVFGDHTRIVKLVDFPFVAGADGSRVFKVQEGFGAEFAAQLLSLQAIPNLGYSRHMRVVRGMGFMSPPRDLQAKFGKAHSSYRCLRPGMTSAVHGIEKVWESLLQRAFSGSLTASWREAHMKELLQEMEQQAKALASANA